MRYPEEISILGHDVTKSNCFPGLVRHKGIPEMARRAEEVASVVKQTIALVRSRIPVSRAFLFGSYLEGTADEYSDIDIAVFSQAADGMTFQEKVSFVVAIERQIKDSIDLHLFGAQSLAKARPTNFFGYICTHGKPID